MDTFVSGVKGSGKTYFAVHTISRLPDPSKVLHNIKGLELGLNMGDLAKEWGFNSPLSFFFNSLHADLLDDGKTPNPMKDSRFDQLRGFLYVVDECQNLFPKSFKNEDVDKFLSMTRHYDIDILFLSQNDSLVCPTIRVHPETQLRAVSSTANPVPFTFLYRVMSGGDKYGEQIGTKRIFRSKKIFNLYRSADTSGKGVTVHKRSKPMMILFILCTIIALCAFLYLKKWSDSKRVPKNISSSSVPAASTSGSASPRSAPGTNRDPAQGGYTSTQFEYPQSIKSLLNGNVPLPVSELNDPSGRYIVLLGTFFRLSEFPFPLYKGPAGLTALVPPDVWEADQRYKMQLAQLGSVDPNSGLYYSDTSDQGIDAGGQSSDTPSF